MRTASKILFIILLGALPMSAPCADVFADFARANTLFNKQEYEQAWQVYHSLIEQGIHDPVLYYNAGCALAGMKENGRAAAMFERALKLDPRMDKAKRNLNRVRPSPPTSQVPFILLPAQWIFTRYTAVEFFSVMIASFWLFGLAGSAWILSRSRIRVLFGAASILLLLVVGTSSAFFFARRHNEQWIEAVALHDNTSSRSGPSEKHLQQDILSAGTKVRCLDQPRDGWIKVQLPNERIGYVAEQSVEIL